MNTLISKQKSKYKKNCFICKKEFETDDADYYNRYPVCSKECQDELDKRKQEAYYQKEVTNIPFKYREIVYEGDLATKRFKENLFITGSSGTGKTVLAAEIAKQCIKNKIKIRWISYPEFIMRLQGLFREDRESPFDEAERIANFNGVLIIDDLGANKVSEWVRQITYYIVNEREQRMLSLIITSNFDLKEIADQIDVRISSRIAGMCNLVKLRGEDKRLRDKDKKWKKGDPKKLKARMIYV